MLAIGRALMSRPKVLLLDEPTIGLAPVIVDELTNTLAMLAREGQTILLVEQNTRMALKLAELVYVIRHGDIVLERPASELRGDDEMFQAYLG
jgi:branched-chain amino acid transport system ATP-binding protein